MAPFLEQSGKKARSISTITFISFDENIIKIGPADHEAIFCKRFILKSK